MEDISTNETKKEEQTEFKKPVLIGRIGKLPKKAKNEPETPVEEKKSEEPKENVSEGSKNSLPPGISMKDFTPIPYKEPKWSGMCPDGSDYALEVLKSGMIVEKIDLTNKAYYVFGRLTNCDVVMAHPTISRHHAVLQYKAFAEEGEPPSGWYLYDLGSTHGTFLNKERMKASHYTRLRVGHQIKFGSSSRTFILLGPDFDCEGESELSVTEIKKRAQDMKLERDRAIREVIEQREKDRLEEEKKREEQGIDWGMGEDAEEETDLAENPYAATTNEELYLDDPKKTLRGYYEREGLELTYDCEERGVGQFICKVELPLDDARGKPVMAEAIHRGKKKDAVVACALEACRILDRAGLLRQAKHESRRRKQRDWSAEDYYDSDEDSFLDRTGAVERKRRERMRRLGADNTEQAPLTYDSLLKQVADLESNISAEEKSLEALRARAKAPEGGDGDELDAYMSSLKHGTMAQKAEISRTKMTIQKLKSELSKTQKLVELARPAHLPPLIKKDDKKMAVKMGSNSVLYGKRIRLKDDAEKRPKIRKESTQQETEFVEEMDSDEEMEKPNEGDSSTKKSDKDSIQTKDDKCMAGSTSGKNETEDAKEHKSEYDKRVFGPMRPPDNYVIPEDYFDQVSDRDLPEITDE
ncbi:hypothetical protein O3G_MSEX003061 [Manduca sexta]|uniref:FHA domain-containing protein n=1 Tax=Manduca sexta TaxID=7130 RepID=A0A921YQE2_MANSE|nr:hypothetical protein O3G_MSEX003061 [Manduca sexta]